jgi:hypothetical protein
MTDDEIRAEIERQIHNTLALLAAKLRERAQHNGPPIAKVLNLTADEIDQLP